MNRAAVLYATREGQTEKIAEHVAATLRDRAMDVDVYNLAGPQSPIDLHRYGAAILAASVHGGHHEPEMIAFVKKHRPELERLSAAFLSVSLSEVGAEDGNAPRERRDQYAADVRKMLDAFVQETGWRPARMKPVAGALRYSHYNFLIRFIMKRIARKAGAATDTARDYEYTDWAALDTFVNELPRPE